MGIVGQNTDFCDGEAEFPLEGGKDNCPWVAGKSGLKERRRLSFQSFYFEAIPMPA